MTARSGRRDDAASGASGGEHLRAMRLDAEGKRGVVLSLTQGTVGNVAIDSTVETFAGLANIRFEGMAPLAQSVKLAILELTMPPWFRTTCTTIRSGKPKE